MVPLGAQHPREQAGERLVVLEEQDVRSGSYTRHSLALHAARIRHRPSPSSLESVLGGMAGHRLRPTEACCPVLTHRTVLLRAKVPRESGDFVLWEVSFHE